MNRLKLYGKVAQVLPSQSYTASNGEQVYTQDFLLDITGDGNYQKQVCFTLRGKSLNENNTKLLVADNDITVHFDLSSYATQTKDGRTFYSTRPQAYRIDQGDTTEQKERKQDNNEPFTPKFATPTGQAAQLVQQAETTQDDLPF